MKQHRLRNLLATIIRVAVEGMRGAAYGVGLALLGNAALVALWPDAPKRNWTIGLLIVLGPYGCAAIGALVGIVRDILRSAEGG